MKAVFLAAGFVGLGLTFMPAQAQVRLNICGAPPLPPCEDQVRRSYDDRYGPPTGSIDQAGFVCRTRTTRCRIDEPRPRGARCFCVDRDGEQLLGRVR